MRDFRGADDLSFTEEEARAIEHAQPAARPLPLVPAWPRARRGVLMAAAGAALLWFLGSRWDSPRGTEIPGAPETVVVAVTRQAVHLRAEPTLRASILATIPGGTVVTVEEQRSDGFHRVAWGSLAGYVASPYVTVSDGVIPLARVETSVADIAGNARLRERASLSARPSGALPALSPITVIGCTRTGWCLIETRSRAGFVWGGLLADHPALPFRPRQQGTERVVILNNRILRP